jgi:hypothetical protein
MEPYSAMQTGAQHERDRLRLLLETRRGMLVSANLRGTTSRVAEIDRMLNMLQPEP